MVIADGGEGDSMGPYPFLSMSALPYTQEDLDDGPQKDQRHSGELQERDFTSVNVDFRQMGVGGITSWGPTALPKYSLPYEDYNYRFILRPLRDFDIEPGQLSSIRYRIPRQEDSENGTDTTKRTP
jgi:hypothetical protein